MSGFPRNLELPGVLGGAQDARFYRLLEDLQRAPNLHLRACAAEEMLRQVWALVPEEDEALFFDNIQKVCRDVNHWNGKYEYKRASGFRPAKGKPGAADL